jgi:hypothetical protein
MVSRRQGDLFSGFDDNGTICERHAYVTYDSINIDLSNAAKQFQKQYLCDIDRCVAVVKQTLKQWMLPDLCTIVRDYLFRSTAYHTDDPMVDVLDTVSNCWTEARQLCSPLSHIRYNDPHCFTPVPGNVSASATYSDVYQYDVRDLKAHVASHGSRIMPLNHTVYSLSEILQASECQCLYAYDTIHRCERVHVLDVCNDSVKIRYYDYDNIDATCGEWDEWIPRHSYRFSIVTQHDKKQIQANYGKFIDVRSIRNIRSVLFYKDALRCYHVYQMITLAFVIECNFDMNCMIDRVRKHVCSPICIP